MKNNKLFLIIVVLIILLILFFYKQINSLTYLTELLSSQFDNSYKTEVHSVDNFLITIAESNCPIGDNGLNCKLNTKYTPLIIIQDKNTNKIISIYDINFRLGTKLDTGNNILRINTIFKNSRFKDFEFLTEWSIGWGGSDGLKGLAVFTKKDDKLLPNIGYPFKSSNSDALF